MHNRQIVNGTLTPGTGADRKDIPSRTDSPVSSRVAQALAWQRAVGNRATAALFGTQASLRPAGDRCERAIRRDTYLRDNAVNLGTVRRAVKARLQGDSTTKPHDTLDTLCAHLALDKVALIGLVKDELVRTGLLPGSYGANIGTNRRLRAELNTILDDVLRATTSRSEIAVSTGDIRSTAAQLFAMIHPAINVGLLQRYTEYRRITALGEANATTYLAFLRELQARFEAYSGQINKRQFTAEALAKNAQMENRIEKLKPLKTQLEGAVDAGSGADVIDPIIAEIRAFVRDLSLLERAWDLDFGLDDGAIDAKVEVLAQNPVFGDHFDEEGGPSDTMAVSDKYIAVMACSLYSILAIKGTWLGTESPEELHNILRKTGKLQDYDDTRVGAKVRYLAGFEPTVVGGETLNQYLAGKVSRREKDSFLVDVRDEPHTFAAKWVGDKYRRFDEQVSGGDFGKYGRGELMSIWK